MEEKQAVAMALEGAPLSHPFKVCAKDIIDIFAPSVNETLTWSGVREEPQEDTKSNGSSST